MDDDLPPSRSSSRSGRGGPDAPPSRSRADYPGGGGPRPSRREEDYRGARPRAPGGGGGSSDRRRYDDAPPPRSNRSSSRDDYDMRPRGGARPPSRGGRDEMDMPRRPRGPAPMPDARGMRPPPPQRYSPNREWRDWDDDEDDDEPSPGGQALKALGVMILFFAIGVGAAFGYYRMSAPKVVGEETPVTSPTVAPSASPSGSPSASPSATKTSFHFDPTGVGGAYIAVVAE
ncbi:MAG TPA: hypothetical protein VHR15_21215 [Ktedonobacterales bacterium]|nr:hypothetical protein [Ktedonobacterales bacterium]